MMNASLLFVSVLIMIPAEDLQVVGGGVSTGPEGLDVVNLQIEFCATDFASAWVLELTALISFENMLSHGNIDS